MHNLGPESTWIGLNIQGDIGPLTLYTSQRSKIVGFLRAPPLNPPTAVQESIRELFREAARQWRALSRAEKDDWAELAARLNAGITGYNLWTHFVRTPNFDALAVYEQRAQITVTRPQPLG